VHDEWNDLEMKGKELNEVRKWRTCLEESTCCACKTLEDGVGDEEGRRAGQVLCEQVRDRAWILSDVWEGLDDTAGQCDDEETMLRDTLSHGQHIARRKSYSPQPGR